MSTVGNVELFFYWLGLTVAIAYLPSLVRNIHREVKLWRAVSKPVYASQYIGFYVIGGFLMTVVESYAASRIRSYGAWVPGDNFGALLVYIILQFVIAAAVFCFFFSRRTMWLSVVFTFAALVLSVIETVFAFQLYAVHMEVFAGVAFVFFSLWMLYMFLVVAGVWYLTNGEKALACHMKKQTKK